MALVDSFTRRKAATSIPSRAAAYVRVSTAEQAEGHSLESQRDACLAYAGQQGWEISEVYEDAGFSATSTARPAFQRMLEDADAGRFDAIIVIRFDRFARELEHWIVIRRSLERKGIRIHSISEPIDDNPMAPVMEALYGGLAEMYSRELSVKVARGHRKRADKGLMLGMPPFGYARVSGADTHQPPAIVPDEAEVVRWAFESFATGERMVDIAEEFNRRGFRTRYRPRRGSSETEGRLWTSQSVSALLANVVYTGAITHRGEVVGDGRHEAIISADLFRQVQRRRESARGRPAAPKRDRYLLRGLAKCSWCGANLQGNHTRSGQGFRYYRETAHRRGRECEGPQTSVRADWLEGEIDARVARFRMPADVRERVIALMADESDEDVEVRRSRTQERLRRLGRQYRDLQVDEAEYEAERRALEAELDRLTLPLSQAATAAQTFDVLQRAWMTASPDEKRLLALTLFEAVYVDMATKTIADVVVAPAFRPWLVAS